MSHSMNTYSRIPVAFTRGERVWVWDESGKKYLDALAGIAVNTLGHGHPKLTRAIAEQSSRLIHASNLYRIAEQERLADKLAAISGMENAFFCNSGCEANEAAIKLARLYGHGKGVESPGIVVMDKAFHGRTLATLSATGNRKVQQGFEPLVPGFVRADRSLPRPRSRGRGLQTGNSRLHVRRQSARLRGSPRDACRDRGRRSHEERRAHRRDSARRAPRGARRTSGRGGGARPRPDDRCRTRPALRRSGRAGLGGGPAHQRHH